MGRRKIVAKIEFEYDVDELNRSLREDEQPEFTDEEMIEYITESFIDDIYAMVKHSEVQDFARISFV